MTHSDDSAPAAAELDDGAGAVGAYAPFAYLSAPNAPLYRRIMRALMAEKERFTVHVRPERVHAALCADGGGTVTEGAVAAGLDRLAEASWGNVLAIPDSSRVTALEEFYRRRMLYQLSRAGEAAERSLAQYDAALGAKGSLQSVALEDIVVLLTSLRDRVGAHEAGGQTDVAVIHQELRSLRERFAELAENAVAFMGSLQRTIDLHDADVEVFLAYKEQLIEYVERFIHDLLVRGAAIAALLEDIRADGVYFLATTAAEREALDAAPAEMQRAVEGGREVWLRQWSGLADWFVSTAGRESEAKLLRSRARAAIPALLAVVRALHDKSGGRTDRAQDFVSLARWFAALPDDGDRHRLWRSAFGLTSVRHLTVTPETEEEWAAADLGNTTPWAQAPAIRISPQLRRTGSYERRGRAARVTDRSNAKAMLAHQAAREAAQTAAARRRLLTGGPRPISAFAQLDPEAFRLFLGLLGDALAALPPGATTAQVHTSDGELTVRLTEVPGAALAVVRTPDGDLCGPDHLVDIASSVDDPNVDDPNVDDPNADDPNADESSVEESSVEEPSLVALSVDEPTEEAAFV